jgi:hypothetical protein
MSDWQRSTVKLQRDYSFHREIWTFTDYLATLNLTDLLFFQSYISLLRNKSHKIDYNSLKFLFPAARKSAWGLRNLVYHSHYDWLVGPKPLGEFPEQSSACWCTLTWHCWTQSDNNTPWVKCITVEWKRLSKPEGVSKWDGKPKGNNVTTQRQWELL